MPGQDRPFDVRNWPGYYGWIILVVGTVGMTAAVPGSPPGMSIFIDDMLEALEIERSGFSLAYTGGTIIAGLGAPFAGNLIDRFGVRLIGCLSFFSLGLVLIFTGLTEQVYRLAGASDRIPGLSFMLVLVAFGGIRLTGVGFAMTVCRSMVFRWFEGRRGWAAAINGVFLSLSFSSAPVLLNGVVVAFGWEATWIGLGFLFALGMTGMAYVFFRDSPEACGVPVESGGQEEGEKVRVPVVRDFTGGEAVRTIAFQVFAAGLALNALIGTGIAFHIVALAAERGVTRETAVATFLPIAIFHITTTLSMGAVVEKIKLKYALALMVGAQMLALYGVANFGETPWRWLYIVASGVAWGTFGVLINIPWPRFFGRRYLGSINGWVTGVILVTSGIGPYLFGLAKGLTGSFLPGVLFCLCLCPVLLFLSSMADNPQLRLGARNK
ncbi:MAG: MFS transporter [Opitutales bacterium]